MAIMPCVDFHIDSTRFSTCATTSIDRLTHVPPAPPVPSQAPSIPSRLPPLDWSPASVRFFNSTDVPRFDAPDSRVDDDESPSPPAVSAGWPADLFALTRFLHTVFTSQAQPSSSMRSKATREAGLWSPSRNKYVWWPPGPPAIPSPTLTHELALVLQGGFSVVLDVAVNGSVIENVLRSSPRISGSSQRLRCSGVAPTASSSAVRRARDASGSGRAELRYGWLRGYRTSIEKWSRWEATVRASVSYVRTRGLSVDSESGLREHLSKVPPELYDATVATELETFVRESSAAAGPGECLVGSTEVLESLFGKWKTLERQESQSGITGLILSLGALLGAWPTSRIQAALEATPVKHVARWCQVNLPASVQSQRRITLSARKV